MSIQGYSAPTPSRNLIRAEMTMLRHAVPYMVLSQFGVQKEQPLKKTDTIMFRRVNPFNMASNGTPQITVANFQLAEGTTPNSNTLTYTDVPVTLQQYGLLYKFTSKTQLMYEDDIPQDMAEQTGEAMAEVGELLRFGVVKGGTSVLYTNGSSRAAVNTPITVNKLRLAARTLESARASKVTTKLGGGVEYGSSPVEASYLVFIHTDLEADFRSLPGFIRAVEYANGKLVHEREIGCLENFRIITSALFLPWLASGSATLNGMVSAGGSNVDVYPVLVTARDAWGAVALKGYGAVKATILPATMVNHANPMGMFGYVGGSMWAAAVRLNENFMTRIECAATNL